MAESAGAVPAPAHTLHVMVVEDDRVQQRLLYKPVSAVAIEEMVAQARTSPGGIATQTDDLGLAAFG